MKQRKTHLRAARAAALAMAVLLPLTGAGCSLFPDDMVQTLPGITSEVTSDVSDAEIVESPLLITEVMSTNSSTLQSVSQATPDWIEICNTGSYAIDLTGYSLSDNLKKPDKWVFPSIIIGAGEYLLVFASGEAATDEADAAGEIHANFRLNGDGDELVLTSPTGLVLARLALPELPADISFGLPPDADSALDSYFFFGVPTPGSANGSDGQTTAAAAIPHPQYALVVNEYMTSNKDFPNAAGDLPDWVELRNTGSEAISLLGFQLTDDPSQPDKWIFPDVTVAAGDVLVVWLSGADIVYDPADPTSLQASFKLGSDDTALLMSDAKGNQVIRQDLEDLPDNISKGRGTDAADSWFYFPQATPGSPNTTAGFSELSGAMTLKNHGVWINEVVAESSSMSTEGKVSQPDWVEIYNGTGEAVSLDGYGLSDDRSSPFRMTLSGLSIAPGEYLVVEPTGFGLSTADETLYLTAPDQTLVDWFDTGRLRNGISSGRGNTGGDEPADTRFFYASPTRGGANATAASLSIALQPAVAAVSAASGAALTGLYFEGAASVTLSSSQSGAVIRYTLDGSTPTSSSPVYQTPLTVSQDTVIRCRAELTGCLPSDTVSRTLLSSTRHDLPVVSIAVNAGDFTGPYGVWTDYSDDHEAAVDVSYYEADGTFGVDFTAGIALHGSYSRKENQKSLELNLRETYGDTQVIYPFFPDNETSTFKRLILRTSGQDWKYTKLRDAFMSELIEDDLNVDTMDWRPCVVYINGEYYGLYEIRENIDEYYMAAHFGTDPDNVDIIKGNAIILSGSMTRYKELTAYVKNHDMNDEAAYQHVLSLIDEQSLIDWIIAETFFNNLDSGNKKFWCENTEGAQWRWAFFDLDWAMFPSTYKLNILRNDLFDPAGHGQSNIFSSVLQCQLIENPEFEKMFIERYAELMNSTFKTDRMLALLDNMTEQIRSEIPRQVSRWGGPTSVKSWEGNVSVLRRITSEKRALMLVILQESFSISDSRMRELFPEDY